MNEHFTAHNPEVVWFKSHPRNQKNSSDLFRGYFFTFSLFTLHSSLFSFRRGIFLEVIGNSE